MKLDVIIADTRYADAIASTGRQSFHDAFAHLFVHNSELTDYLDYTYSTPKVARSIHKENNIFFLALDVETPVGFVKLKKLSLNPQIDSYAQAELQKIYVLTAYHGKGVGAALMCKALECAGNLNVETLWLDVHISNRRAIRFYEKYGFKNSGKHFFNIGTQTFEYDLMALPLVKNGTK